MTFNTAVNYMNTIFKSLGFRIYIDYGVSLVWVRLYRFENTEQKFFYSDIFLIFIKYKLLTQLKIMLNVRRASHITLVNYLDIPFA